MSALVIPSREIVRAVSMFRGKRAEKVLAARLALDMAGFASWMILVAFLCYCAWVSQ